MFTSSGYAENLVRQAQLGQRALSMTNQQFEGKTSGYEKVGDFLKNWGPILVAGGMVCACLTPMGLAAKIAVQIAGTQFAIPAVASAGNSLCAKGRQEQKEKYDAAFEANLATLSKTQLT